MKQKRQAFMSRLRQVLGSDRGNVLVLVGLIIAGLIGVGGLAVDYARASGLYQKLQQATEIAVREAVRGKSDAEVKNFVYGQMDAYMKSLGFSSAQASITLNLSRGADGVVKLTAQTAYQSLFGALYSVAGYTMDVGAAATARALCTPPAAQTQWVSGSGTCPGGQVGTITFQKEQTRAATCASETAVPVWGSWTDTGKQQNVVNTCYTPCVVPAAQTQWVSSSAACPAGYTGSNTWEAEQKRTAYCPSPSATPVWNAWAATGTTRNASNTCAPPPAPCVAPAAQKQWVDRSASCPAGQTGQALWQAEQQRSAYCPASTGAYQWNSWADTGSVRNQTNNCVQNPGDAIWTVPGTYQWTVPPGITSISAVAIGGGAGGAWTYNSVSFQYNGGQSSVTGGSFTLTANGGTKVNGGCGGSKQGGGCGGAGYVAPSLFVQYVAAGGGGAGGYSGNGGKGGTSRAKNQTAYAPKVGTGGAGGGGDAELTSTCNPGVTKVAGCQGQGGGGVGLYGQGPDGAAGGLNGGSGGGNGAWSTYQANSANGGSWGGGGGTVTFGAPQQSGGGGELSWANNITVTPGQVLTVVVGAGGNNAPVLQGVVYLGIGKGQGGAVRILWGGGRSFPSNASW
ncbi:hypothetical protein EZH22_31065 (plasmid) [Xanthobacter dioxanivorans]|uniref:Uncharacterized protein n=1 Tax=Xanthobacter dioxanivorans TaxID=2528964 RepID=A0A974PUW2_9HYPH|nr:pilus assembly protein TadG-related protein [Xanthobacter dioxanivorans]QRG10214.1 hypothetical protein EZH22_31065 [Xanthobacter dioxanivorans]